MSEYRDPIALAKAVLWEEAKGKLRAMVAVEGQCGAHNPEDEQRRIRWREAEIAINAFAKDFEDRGLHE
jgi:hypothetical protein